MSEGSVVQVVLLVGWLALILYGFRSWRVSRNQTLLMIGVWVVIFGVAAIAFGALM